MMTRVRLHNGQGFRRRMATLLAGAALALAATPAFGAGTPAGTPVSNRATASYNMNGRSFTQLSNESTFLVDDKVTFTLSAADAAAVAVTPGGRACLTYVLSNTGNAEHDFTLEAAVAGAPTLNPGGPALFYADPEGRTPLPVDASAGLPYVASLAPDASRNVYLCISAPAAPVEGQSLNYVVTAESFLARNLGVRTPPVKSATAAAAEAGQDKNGQPMQRFVVLADGHGSGGDQDRDGRYALVATDGSGNGLGFTVRTASVNIAKTAVITDRGGGSQPSSGATISYALAVTVAGSGTAVGVVVTDPIPANTSYLPGTLKLNGSPLSDAADADAGDVGATTAGVVTVRLGDLSRASGTQTITFDVKVD